MVNGEDVGPIIPGRGLRQGDSLSFYLFILCAEGLSLLIESAEDRGEIRGCKVCRGAIAPLLVPNRLTDPNLIRGALLLITINLEL